MEELEGGEIVGEEPRPPGAVHERDELAAEPAPIGLVHVEQGGERRPAHLPVANQGARDRGEILAIDQQGLRPARNVGKMEQAPARDGALGPSRETVPRILRPRLGKRAIREGAVARLHEEEARHGPALTLQP